MLIFAKFIKLALVFALQPIYFATFLEKELFSLVLLPPEIQ